MICKEHFFWRYIPCLDKCRRAFLAQVSMKVNEDGASPSHHPGRHHGEATIAGSLVAGSAHLQMGTAQRQRPMSRAHKWLELDGLFRGIGVPGR